MGWWTVRQSGQEILQGDEPYDIMGDALEQIAQVYQRDVERKPTLAEIIQTIQTVLAAGVQDYAADGEKIEITKVRVKTRKVHPQTFHVGDFFAIPLKRGRYAFGRILSDLEVHEMGLLIAIYDRFSTEILNPAQLKGERFTFAPFYYGGEAWKTGRWMIIGNMAIESTEFTYPKYKEGAAGLGWWIRNKDKVVKATEEEVRDLEYATLRSTKAVEQRIYDYLEGKTTEEKSS